MVHAGFVISLEVGIVAMHFCAVKMNVNSSCIICCLSMPSTITASQRHSQQHVSTCFAIRASYLKLTSVNALRHCFFFCCTVYQQYIIVSLIMHSFSYLFGLASYMLLNSVNILILLVRCTGRTSGP